MACRKIGCNGKGTKSCGACGLASYCSAACQKEDWKVHKLACIDVKKLPTTFLPMSEIFKFLQKQHAQTDVLRSEGKIKELLDLSKIYLEFLERQYGVQAEGKSYCIRSNGDKIDSMLLIDARVQIANTCFLAEDADTRFEYATAARKMLETRDKSEYGNLLALSETERLISQVHAQNRDFDKAEYHCQQSLMFARLIKGGGKRTDDARVICESHALRNFAQLRVQQSRRKEATKLFEESYILVSGAHGPVHPRVQDAATQLINALVASGDSSKADNFCRMNYENIIDPRNGMSDDRYQVADAMLQLATIWNGLPTVSDEKAAFAAAEEAEDMIRKAYSTFEILYGHDSVEMASYSSVFADVLIKRGKYTDEARGILEHTLGLFRSNPTTLNPQGMFRCLNRLARFHDHVSGTVPQGAARNKEIQSRNGYFEEAKALTVMLGMGHGPKLTLEGFLEVKL